MRLFPVSLFLILLAACDRPAKPIESVKWPEIEHLDDLTVELEKADADEARKLLATVPSIVETIRQSVPEGVRQPEQVEVLLKDLAAQAEAAAGDTSDPESQAKALHILTESLSEAAGMPHHCDHDH